MSSTQLLMLPSDTPCYTAIDKSGATFHPNCIISPHKLRTPTSARDNSPFVNCQLFPDGSSVTSLTDASDGELQINDDVDSDADDAVPRKRQKTQNGSNARIIVSNVLVTSRDQKSTIVDGGSRKHKLPSVQNFATPTVSAVDSEDTRMTRVAISNTEPNLTTTTSSCVQIDSTVVDGGSKKHGLPSLQNFTRPTILEVDSEDTCATRASISNTEDSPTSTSSISSCIQIDSSPTTVRTTPALSQNEPAKERKEDNSTLTHSRKRVDELSGHLVSRPLAVPSSTSISDSSNSGIFKQREEPPKKIRGLALRPTNWSYGTKSRKSQGRIADQDELELWTNADVAYIGFRKPDEQYLLDKVEEESTKRNLSHILTCLMEMDAKSSSENAAGNEGAISNCAQAQVAAPESVGEKRTFKAQDWTKMVKKIKAVDGLEGQQDKETRGGINSPQVPSSQLENWSTTLRSLIKGKKKFQHQDLIDLKNALQEIYNKRQNISDTSSLAQEVYKVTQLEVHDVPNQDELKLRALARKSTQYWGIRNQRDA